MTDKINYKGNKMKKEFEEKLKEANEKVPGLKEYLLYGDHEGNLVDLIVNELGIAAFIKKTTGIQGYSWYESADNKIGIYINKNLNHNVSDSWRKCLRNNSDCPKVAETSWIEYGCVPPGKYFLKYQYDKCYKQILCIDEKKNIIEVKVKSVKGLEKIFKFNKKELSPAFVLEPL